MKVVVIGGGIAGLTTAYEIKRKSNLEVTVLEAEKNVGGQVISERGNGFIFDAGAEGFVDEKPWTIELCTQLGVTDKFLKASRAIARRYFYSEGKLRMVPTTPVSFFTSDFFSLHGRLRIMLEPFTKKIPDDVEETMAEFGKRHFGEEFVRKLFDPMATGVFAGDPYKLSIKSAFPMLSQMEKMGDGSLVRAVMRMMRQRGGMKKPIGPSGALVSLKDGIGYITVCLEKELKGSIRVGKKVTEVVKVGEKYEVRVQGGEKIEADAVVVATPAYSTADMLEKIDPSITEKLREIPYPSMAVICLGYPKYEVSHPLDGFGFMVTASEKKNILGCTWDTTMFPSRAPEGHVLMRVFVGGTRDPEISHLKDEELLRVVKKDMKTIMGIDAEPTVFKIYRYEKAIPLYTVGHKKRVSAIDERLKEHKGLFLTGNTYRGVGINDTVHEAMITADRVLEFFGLIEKKKELLWTKEALGLLNRVPSFARDAAKQKIEAHVRDKKKEEITAQDVKEVFEKRKA